MVAGYKPKVLKKNLGTVDTECSLQFPRIQACVANRSLNWDLPVIKFRLFPHPAATVGSPSSSYGGRKGERFGCRQRNTGIGYCKQLFCCPKIGTLIMRC